MKPEANDYLWDRTGEPDPEIERLEKLLAPLGDPGTPRRRRLALSRRTWVAPLAMAASMAAIGLFAYRFRPPLERWIDTSKQDVEVAIPEMGNVQLARGSKARVESQGAGNYRMRLEEGKLEAFIWAPPRQFFVDTPSALAVDLGCAYTLEVSPSGDALVSVRTGWVAFEREGRESFIPAGARCRTSNRFGLGIPYFSDAPEGLRSALVRFEESGRIDLANVAARPRDAVTFWHLLRRVRENERGAAYDRLTGLVVVPPTVSRDAALRGDTATLNALWDALELGEAGFWRRWKQQL